MPRQFGMPKMLIAWSNHFNAILLTPLKNKYQIRNFVRKETVRRMRRPLSGTDIRDGRVNLLQRDILSRTTVCTNMVTTLQPRPDKNIIRFF